MRFVYSSMLNYNENYERANTGSSRRFARRSRRCAIQLSRYVHLVKLPRPGLELRSARFEVQILGEELFSLLRRISRQYVAFLIPFSPPVGYEPQTPGLTASRFFKMSMSFKKIFAILDVYIIQIRMLCKYSY
jgi:hypothetical protein